MNPFRTGVPAALFLALLVACDSEPTQPPPPTAAPVASITLDPGALPILVGQTRTLAVVLKDADGKVLSGRTHTFTSDKPPGWTEIGS
jgi:hypothetical protein